MKLSADKLFKLEEKLDSLINSNLKDPEFQRKNPNFDKSIAESNILDTSSSNISASFNLNKLLIFSNVLFITNNYISLHQIIKKSKLPKSMQRGN